MERTLILVKPDGVQRGLIGAIVGRFETRGLKLVGMKLLQMSDDLAARHYAVHEGKPFYDSLVQYIVSGPVVAMVWEGKKRGCRGSNDDGHHEPSRGGARHDTW